MALWQDGCPASGARRRPLAAAVAADPKSAAPPARSGFRIESWSRTHEGRVRSHNEDSYVARDDDGPVGGRRRHGRP